MHRALQAGRLCVERGERDAGRVTAAMTAVLVAEPLVTPDYAVVVDSTTLRCPSEVHGEVRLLVAATVGAVRLIDNERACSALAPLDVGHDRVLVNTGVNTGEER